MTTPRSKSGLVGRTQRGSALLTVLWISAALAAVAFSLANTVRGETDRTSTELDEIRSYYLAAGAVDRAAIEVLWSANFPNPMIPKGAAWVDYTFPTGSAHVELIPETAKLDVNNARPEQLGRLMGALGIDPNAAQQIVSGIIARRPGGGGAPGMPSVPSFPAPAASFQEIEELLQVRGVTPEIFYGTYVPAQSAPGSGEPALVRRSGLVDCLSVYGSRDRVDVNTADPAVLAAIGLSPDAIQLILRERRAAAFTEARLNGLMPSLGPGANLLRREGNAMVTIRATARVRLPNGQLSDLKRTVAVQVRYMPQGFDSPIHTLRWYDTTWSH
jgi:general secretion pathway protein K